MDPGKILAYPLSTRHVNGRKPLDLTAMFIQRIFFKSFFLKSLPEDTFIDFEREEEREKNINVGEKHRSVASHRLPNWGPNPQTRYVS